MVKRVLDVVIAGTALLALSPIILLAALLVHSKIGSPVLFRQTRPGLNGHPFEMFKFRTMRQATGKDGRTQPDEERLTPFGRALRSTSIDELPELWNVLKGEMSLVGPRPLLMEYLPHYSPRQANRHKMRPGITGWAQINGRNAITWEQKFELDLWYIENQSLLLDIKILWLTALRVLARSGISPEHSATPEKFSDYMRSKGGHG